MWSYTGDFSPYYHRCGCSAGQQPEFSPPAYYWPHWPPYYAPAPPEWPAPEPPHSHGHHEEHIHMANKEVVADSKTTSTQAVIGGTKDVHLTLEYAVDSSAASPSVAVSISDLAGTTVFKAATIAPGFHVKEAFASAAAGATVKLDVSECTAQLKWFENAS